MVKLLIIGVTQNTSQNRISDTITHVTLNIMNDVDFMKISNHLEESIEYTSNY
jgi:hypothetical protein